MTLRDWVTSHRRFGETWCLRLRCFKVPRYSLRTRALRSESDTFSRNVGSHLPSPEMSHLSRPQSSPQMPQISRFSVALSQAGRLICWLLTPCRITDSFRHFGRTSQYVYYTARCTNCWEQFLPCKPKKKKKMTSGFLNFGMGETGRTRRRSRDGKMLYWVLILTQQTLRVCSSQCVKLYAPCILYIGQTDRSSHTVHFLYIQAIKFLINFLDFLSPSSFISPQNVVYFLMLSFLVHKILTFYINGALNCKFPAPGSKG